MEGPSGDELMMRWGRMGAGHDVSMWGCARGFRGLHMAHEEHHAGLAAGSKVTPSAFFAVQCGGRPTSHAAQRLSPYSIGRV